MVLFPEVQKAAQAEIDSVIGNDRLPGFKDQENLPYIRALVLEVVRFHSVVPTGERLLSSRNMRTQIFQACLIE